MGTENMPTSPFVLPVVVFMHIRYFWACCCRCVSLVIVNPCVFCFSPIAPFALLAFTVSVSVATFTRLIWAACF